MSLWTLLLAALGVFGANAVCPPSTLIHPCTCNITIDKFGEDFSVVSCRNVDSEQDLMQILEATRGKKLFEFQIIESSLRYIPRNAFINTTFQVLSFENSSISALSDSDIAFQGLENSLRLLDITNCSFMTNWDWRQLSHLNHLMEISVMQSDLLDIANGLASVQHLEFETFVFKENKIEWLDNFVFAPFELLTRVTLDRNRIKHVQRTMFPRPARHLKIFGLSYNKISSLPGDLFIDMPALSSLYLTGNPLQIIDETTFKPIWYQLKLFFFYDTNLSCDCRLNWITKMDNSQIYIRSFCNSPAHVKGRKITSMQSHELWCKRSTFLI